MGMVCRLVVSLTVLGLSGCGVVTIASSPPALTPSLAQMIVRHYYDTCHERDEIGQCADILATKGDYYHLSVAPALRHWVRIRLRLEPATSSLGSPPQKVAVLTAEGAQHCISMFGTSERAGAEAAGCSWLYAPASVTVRRIDQHNGIASVAAVVRFAPTAEMWS